MFRTPSLALTYSNEGLSGCSRKFHKWARLHKIANGNTLRKVLLNSWEGVYFDINEQRMEQMMNDIASMGGELFVMDDGWFGDKYPRKNDSYGWGIGRWTGQNFREVCNRCLMMLGNMAYGLAFG